MIGFFSFRHVSDFFIFICHKDYQMNKMLLPTMASSLAYQNYQVCIRPGSPAFT